MTAAFADQYHAYMVRSGMFLPRPIECIVAKVPFPRSRALRMPLAFALLLTVTVGSALALRRYTISQLPLWSNGRASVLAVLPGDMAMLQHRMEDVLQLPEVEARLAQGSGAILGYIVPTHYVMQGMIADTDPAYRLYEHHQTVSMIVDWIFHPFRHLEGGHDMMHHAAVMTAASASPTLRRIIFLRVAVDDDTGASDPAALFAMGASRIPQFFIDVDLHTLSLQDVKELGPGTGWGDVPTPMF